MGLQAKLQPGRQVSEELALPLVGRERLAEQHNQEFEWIGLEVSQILYFKIGGAGPDWSDG